MQQEPQQPFSSHIPDDVLQAALTDYINDAIKRLAGGDADRVKTASLTRAGDTNVYRLRLEIEGREDSDGLPVIQDLTVNMESYIHDKKQEHELHTVGRVTLSEEMQQLTGLIDYDPTNEEESRIVLEGYAALNKA